MAKIAATEIRANALIVRDGRLLRVVACRHVHVGGRGGAYMQVEAKDAESGAKIGMRIRTDEKIERPFVETRAMRFLYREGDSLILMDEENFEQSALPAAALDGREGYLLADAQVQASVYEGRVVAVALPQSVTLQVADTAPQVKGATASASYKPATMETGITVMVPPFVSAGEKIRVSTETGEYQARGGD
jgi:elongation factor P